MSFFSRFIPASRRGQRNFERGRAAEQRGDIAAAKAHFHQGALDYDSHLEAREKARRPVHPSHLVRAGICYVRIGRDSDALRVFERALTVKEIPDAFLHAGYAAAKLGDREAAVRFWSEYPAWAGQAVIARTLTLQVAAIVAGADLDAACRAVATAVRGQDRENAKVRPTIRHSRPVPPHRGY
jgi:tetratricopeptide (TPR) repeat protein